MTSVAVVRREMGSPVIFCPFFITTASEVDRSFLSQFHRKVAASRPLGELVINAARRSPQKMPRVMSFRRSHQRLREIHHPV
ncbi:MAG: hypothetical protein ABF876_07290 [Acetobacter aceti]